MTHSARMNNMTRADLRGIGSLAMAQGLSLEQAREALSLGARALSRGIDAYDIDRLAAQRIEWLTRADIARNRKESA